MQPGVPTAAVGRKNAWAGYILSAIPILALLFAGSLKLLKLPSVVQGLVESGYPARQVPLIGLLEVGCTVVYLIPRTAALGAILMTGFLGGAIASSMRIGNPVFIAPFILGVLVWGGLYLRDQRLRALIPWRH